MDSPDLDCMSPEALRAEVARLREELKRRDAADAASRLVTARLRAERDAYRNAFDNAPDIQVWCDLKGRLIRCNKATMAAVGDGEIPPDFTVLNDPQLIVLGIPELFARAATGETVAMPRYPFNVANTHGGGPDEDLWLETLLQPVFGESGMVESVIVHHRDVTAEVRAENELKALTRARDEAWAVDDAS